MWEKLTITGFTATDIGIVVDFLEAGQEVSFPMIMRYMRRFSKRLFGRVMIPSDGESECP